MKSKNHFFFTYTGNKREEFKTIYPIIAKDIETKQINTIIEPFCGSCAFSVMLSIEHPNKFTYILNDLDENLILLFEMCRDKAKWEDFVKRFNKISESITSKDDYIKALAGDDILLAWFVGRVICSGLYSRGKLYPYGYKPKTFSFENLPIVKFLQNENIILLNTDGMDVYINHSKNSNSLLFIDPPYMLSDNSDYKYRKTQIYEFCSLNKIEDEEAFIIFSLEKIWIVDLLFSDCRNYIEYDKKYRRENKVKTTHVVISN